MENKKKIVRKGLGKGLGALLSGSDKPSIEGQENSILEKKVKNEEIAIENISINPYQPRKAFDEKALRELALSIGEQGLIQPLTVRQLSDESFQLIAGERRFQASKLAGLKKVPVYIVTVTEQEAMEMALIENIQREDLNAIEIAESYGQIMKVLDLTQDELADRVHKDRSTVSNYLRLLKLPNSIREGLNQDLISMGHARALLGLEDVSLQESLYKKIIDFNLTVRDVEGHVKNAKKGVEPKKASVKKKVFPSKTNDYHTEVLSKFFNQKVQVKLDAKSKGTVNINYENRADFDLIIEKITRK